MAEFAVWFEGVDFDETVFDSQKLSVIRGASRALETLGPLISHELAVAKLPFKTVASGASMAGFVVTGAEEAVRACLSGIRARCAGQGRDADDTRLNAEKLKPDSGDADVIAAAPLAHLRILVAMVPVTDGDAGRAIARAQAGVRRQQLSGAHVHPLASGDTVCEFDHKRAARTKPTKGPAKPGQTGSSDYALSEASAARWHFGRAERQIIYSGSGVQHRAFTDDFRELVADPPQLASGKELPVSAQRKIAVMMADGDAFGAAISALSRSCGGVSQARQILAAAMQENMAALLKALADGIAALTGSAGLFDDLKDGKRRARLETLLYGGDDATFVVPSWLALWLVGKVNQITSDWNITADFARQTLPGAKVAEFSAIPLRFSMGLVIAGHNTPVRSVKALAQEAMYNAKAEGGGLDFEVLESVEPPHGNLAQHRLWYSRMVSDNGDVVGGFAVPRQHIASHLSRVMSFWAPERPFPASQAHRALREGMAKLKDSSLAAAQAEADAAVREKLSTYAAQEPVWQSQLEGLGLLSEGIPGATLRLLRLLQLRDYAIAASVAPADEPAGR